MRKVWAFVIALVVVTGFICPVLASQMEIVGPYGETFGNMYAGGSSWFSQWPAFKQAMVDGTAVNMVYAPDPRFVGDSGLITPWFETVYSFQYPEPGDYGWRIHAPLMIHGMSIAQLTGNIQSKTVIDWDTYPDGTRVEWTFDSSGDWTINALDIGWGAPSLELSLGALFVKTGFSWWGGYGHTSPTPEAIAALNSDVQGEWDNQTTLTITYRIRKDA